MSQKAALEKTDHPGMETHRTQQITQQITQQTDPLYYYSFLFQSKKKKVAVFLKKYFEWLNSKFLQTWGEI